MRLFIGPVGGEPLAFKDGVPVTATEDSVGPMREIQGIKNLQIIFTPED